MCEIKEGCRVVVKSYPVTDIVGKTGVVVKVNPFPSKYTKNTVRFDVPLDPSGCTLHWFADDDLEVLE